jgi:hypothetical protein
MKAGIEKCLRKFCLLFTIKLPKNFKLHNFCKLVVVSNSNLIALKYCILSNLLLKNASCRTPKSLTTLRALQKPKLLLLNYY